MAVFFRYPRARKQHVCERCTKAINKGEPHVYWSVPPHSAENDSDGWWYGRTHSNPNCTSANYEEDVEWA